MSDTSGLESLERLLPCLNACLEKKPKRLTVINIRDYSSFADYLVIMSGTSDRQVRALADGIREKLKKLGLLPLGVEGEQAAQWILMDYDDIIVHIFQETVRQFYDLERLWSEAKRIDIAENTEKITEIDPSLSEHP